jgi:ankyrin repeat protein
MGRTDFSLFEAVKSGDLSLVTASLLNTKNLNERFNSMLDNRIGWTALHLAVSMGQLEIVRCLLEAGADINAQEDKDDRTPLLMAVCMGGLEMTKLLLSFHADINLQQLDGDTPLLRAASEGYADIVSLLLEAGANVHLTDNLGWTALIWASTNGHKDVVNLLIKNKNTLHEKETNEDRTALLIAASLGNTEITKLLLLGKYDTTTPSMQKAMMAAATNGHFEIVELLRNYQS